jgi:hypothetical protein
MVNKAFTGNVAPNGNLTSAVAACRASGERGRHYSQPAFDVAVDPYWKSFITLWTALLAMDKA